MTSLIISVGQHNINVLSTNKDSSNIHDNPTTQIYNETQHNPINQEKSSNLGETNPSFHSSNQINTNSNTPHINNDKNVIMSHDNTKIQLNPSSDSVNFNVSIVKLNQSFTDDTDIQTNPPENFPTILTKPTDDVLSTDDNDKVDRMNLSATDITTTTANQEKFPCIIEFL